MSPLAAISTLVFGFVAGYIGQRSRYCTVSGYRDWVLTRDTALLKGIASTFGGALVGYVAFGALGGFLPAFPFFTDVSAGDMLPWILIIIGGLGLGAVGALSGGCPFRMHVLATEGRRAPQFYLLGFYIGIVFFNIVLSPFFETLGLPL